MFILPTYNTKCYYDDPKFPQYRTGTPLHLAIHDYPKIQNEIDGNTFIDVATEMAVDLPINETMIDSLDDVGNTPLHTAIIVGYNTGQYITMYAILRTLLNMGANRLIKNNANQTPKDLIKNIITYVTTLDEEEEYLKHCDHQMFRVHIGVMKDVLNNLFPYELGDKVKILEKSSCYVSSIDLPDQFPVGTIGYVVYIRQRYKNTPNYYCQYKISLENTVCSSNDLRHLYLKEHLELLI